MSKHIVQFDKVYLSGRLKDLLIPGEICTWPDYGLAQRHAALLQRCERECDFLRDAATGERYKVSNVQLYPAA